MALDGYAAVLCAGAQEGSSDEYAVHRRCPSKHWASAHRESALRRGGMGRGRHEPAVQRAGPLQSSVCRVPAMAAGPGRSAAISWRSILAACRPPTSKSCSTARPTKIQFNSSGEALGVEIFNGAPGWTNPTPALAASRNMRPGGLLVMAAGALVTPRLLLLSGVGPRGREAEIFPNGSSGGDVCVRQSTHSVSACSTT